MSNHPRSIINQIDLKKKKLESQIYQLQKQLKKQDKYHHQQIKINTHGNSKSPITHQHKYHHTINSNSTSNLMNAQQPAISQNWKQLFKIDPQLYKEEQCGYFSKDYYRNQIQIDEVPNFSEYMGKMIKQLNNDY